LCAFVNLYELSSPNSRGTTKLNNNSFFSCSA
jgi:hypothetical protein